MAKPDQKSVESAPVTSKVAPKLVPVVLECRLIDKSAGRPMGCVDIELVPIGGGAPVLGTTDTAGNVMHLDESTETGKWEALQITPGEWIVGPNVYTYDSHYQFAPIILKVPDDGKVGTKDVIGDNEKNARLLAIYVGNLFEVGRDAFLANMKLYSSSSPTDEQVKKAANSALHLMMKGFALLLPQDGRPPEDKGLPPEFIEQICKDVDADNKHDNIPCSLCYTRYSSNPSRLQTCLCCAPCIP